MATRSELRGKKELTVLSAPMTKARTLKGGLRQTIVAIGLALTAACGEMRPDAAAPEVVQRTEGALLADGSLALTAQFSSTGAAPTTAVAGAPLTGARFVTATNGGTFSTLDLTVWQAVEGPQVVNKLFEKAFAIFVIDKVAVAHVDSTRFVVAAHGLNDNIVVSSFAYDPLTNVVALVNSISPGTGTELSMTSLTSAPETVDGDGHVVLAYRRASNGALILTDFSVAANGTIMQNGSASAGAVPSVAIAAVPGSQFPKSLLSQKASLNTSENTLAVCANGVDDDGDGFTDGDDWDCCGLDGFDGQGACTQGLVVTATPNNVGNLKLISWRVSAAGRITRLKDVGGLAATASYDLAPVSFGRVAAFSTTGGHPTLVTYDIDATTGVITPRDTKAAGVARNATRVRLVNGGGARLFLPFSDSTGAGFLETLETIDAPLAENRIQVPGSFWSNPGAAFGMGGDRVVFAQTDASQQLLLRVYRDFNVPLVRGVYIPTAAGAGVGESRPPFTYVPEFGPGGDATIAASKLFLAVCGNDRTAFYNKKNPGEVVISTFSHEALFSSVLTEVTSPNEQNLNRHLSFQSTCDPTQPTSALNQCDNATFDTRCAYDETTQRFVLTSMVRFMKDGDRKNGKPKVCTLHSDCGSSFLCSDADRTCHDAKDRRQRFIAVAVSKTVDPRDGFNVYIAAENKYDDNPTISASSGMFVIAHNAAGGGDGVFPNEAPWPSAYVLDIADMSTNAASVRATKIPRWQLGSGMNSVQVGKVRGPFDWGMLYHRDSGQYSVTLFKKPSRGPVAIVPMPVPTTGSGQISQAAFVVDDLGSGNSKGQFYFPELLGGVTVQATSADLTMTPGTMTLGASHAIDVPDCGGASNTSCRMPAVAVNGTKVSMIYGRFENDVIPCAAGVVCATGVCSAAGTCVAVPGFHALRQTVFNRALTQVTSTTTLRTATVMYFKGSTPAWDESPTNMQFPCAVPDPSSATETFAIHDLYDVQPNGNVAWGLVVAAMK